MWSRVVEVMLGCWLLVSPFVFSHPESRAGWWINDLGSGSAVIVFGLLSFWRPTQHAHLLTALVGGWLIGFAYTHIGAAPPAAQNHVLLGWLLVMFAVIPNLATRPPKDFDREYHEIAGF